VQENIMDHDSSTPPCDFHESRLIWKFRGTLPADIESINPVVELILAETLKMGCSQGKELAIETALREALANAIVHGCKGNPDAKVEVCAGCEENRGILIVVKNPGSGFDPLSIPNPVLAQNIFTTHGRGIFLINQLMDEVHFKNGGTEIHMRKY
jgi:serine/threonine-protein kinase RsbW